MTPHTEKRLFQIVGGLACLVPLVAGASGVIGGPDRLGGEGAVPVDLDSHFRYLSGIFLGVGIAFASCIPAIQNNGTRFRLLGSFVVIGGFARLLSLVLAGTPSAGPLFGLCMELGVVPLLMLWQAGLAKRYRAGGSAPSPTSAVGG